MALNFTHVDEKSTKQVKSDCNRQWSDCIVIMEIEYKDLPENRWEKRHNTAEKRRKRSSLARCRVADKQIGKCISVVKNGRARGCPGQRCVYTVKTGERRLVRNENHVTFNPNKKNNAFFNAHVLSAKMSDQILSLQQQQQRDPKKSGDGPPPAQTAAGKFHGRSVLFPIKGVCWKDGYYETSLLNH